MTFGHRADRAVLRSVVGERDRPEVRASRIGIIEINLQFAERGRRSALGQVEFACCQCLASEDLFECAGNLVSLDPGK
jgi:hypothetical protein